MHALRSVRGPRLFYINSRRKDEAAFDLHAELPHTGRLLARARPLIYHALDVTLVVAPLKSRAAALSQPM